MTGAKNKKVTKLVLRFSFSSGASLVSIRDVAEEKFIEDNIVLLESYKEFWIGLFHSQKGNVPNIPSQMKESLLFNSFPVPQSLHTNSEWTHGSKRVGYKWTHPGLSNYTGHWLWSDYSVVDYTNWASENDYEDDYGDHSWNPDCALFCTKSKKWKKRHCDYTVLPFICKTPKGMYCK